MPMCLVGEGHRVDQIHNYEIQTHRHYGGHPPRQSSAHPVLAITYQDHHLESKYFLGIEFPNQDPM